MRRSSCFLAFLLISLSMVGSVRPAFADTRPAVTCGWYLWDPYQYLDEDGLGKKNLTGLDVKLVHAIFGGMGYDVKYGEVSWAQHQLDIRDGVRDIAAGAFVTPYREVYSYFSAPYREEINVLYVRRGESGKYGLPGIHDLLAALAKDDFKVAVLSGYSYALPEVNTFVRDPENVGRIVFCDSWENSFETLLQDKVDGILIDRIVAATIAWRRGLQSKVEEHPMKPIKDSIHMMFSKATTTPEMVEKFNDSVKELKASGEYDRIYREYFYPVMISLTVKRPWFFVIDIIGTIAFAISGVLLARREKYSIFGALVLAALPAVGGGVLRDILVDRRPLGIMRDPAYMICVLFTVGAGFLVFRIAAHLHGPASAVFDRLKRIGDGIILTCDAMGLAAFTVTGVVIALEMKSAPLWLWGTGMAVITSCGGGILRDMVRNDPQNPTLKGSFYAEVALIWGLALSLFFTGDPSWHGPTQAFIAVIVTIAGAFVTRMLAIFFKLKSPFI